MSINQLAAANIVATAIVPAERPRGANGEFNVAAHGLRGVASVMVLCAHILGGTSRHIYPDNLAYADFVRHPWFFGTFGVDLFFVISGFVILPSVLRYSPADFALRRFLRLYPLFLACTVAFIVLNSATNLYPRQNNIESIVSALLFINLFTGTEQLAPNAWSLSFEVVFYALAALVVYWTVKRPRALPGALAIGACVLFFAAFPMTIYFVAGGAIHLLRRRDWRIAGARLLEVVCAVAMVGFASRGHFEYRWADFADPVLVPIIVSTSLYFFFATGRDSLTASLLGNRVAAYLGTISYSLYLVHPFVYYAVRTVFVHHGWFTADIVQSMTAFAGVVIALSLAASHVVHVTLERGPYRWYFHQGIYHRRAAGTQ